MDRLREHSSICCCDSVDINANYNKHFGIVLNIVNGNSSMTVIDRCIMTNKNILPKREYNDGDIVKFDFEPNSLDIHWHKVSIIGVVSGILYENDGICYKVQLRDNERCIFGDMIVPEEKINGTITDSVVTVKCDFCDLRTYVDQDNADDIERKTKGWGKFYCLGKKCHVLNMCNRCMEILENVDTKKCPYDSCGIVSKKQKEYLEKQGISLVDKL